MLAMSGATDIQRIAINGATDAIRLFKDKAEKTAEVLDSFNKIQDAINGPGNKQASDIINQATNATNSPLADSTEFTRWAACPLPHIGCRAHPLSPGCPLAGVLASAR